MVRTDHCKLALDTVAPPARGQEVGLQGLQRIAATVPANGALRFAGMFLPGDFLGGQMQDRLDGGSTGDINDLIDGSLGGLDQAHQGQKELTFLLEELAQRPTVMATGDLIL